MAYINTIDERYGGTYLSGTAGQRDAPYSTTTNYTLAEGIWNAAYGALIPYNYSADGDAYSLGILSSGYYTITASGYNWDFSNSIFGSTPTLEIYNSTGALLGTSSLGSIDLTINASETIYVAVKGKSYSSSEYQLHYTYDGPLVVPNQAPAASDRIATINEDTSWALNVADFGFSDWDAGDSLQAVLVSAPSAGSLKLNGVPLTSSTVVTATELALGNLVFSPTENANGSGYSSFYFGVYDGKAWSNSLVYTFTFNVTSVRDDLILNGTTGNDTISGDKVDVGSFDVLNGLAGSDTLSGLAGDDTLNGGTGADTMLGGAGNDTYYVDNAGDKVYETTTTASATNAGGIDTVISSVTFDLSAYTGVTLVENLTLTGSSAINGTGNTLSNTLVGNSANNVLNGKSGADIMLGGAGNDTYYVDNASDKVYETTTNISGIDAGGTDTVYSYLSSYTLGNFIESGRVMSAGVANLTGNGLSNTIFAGKGDNVLAGGAGIDTLSYASGANGTTGVKVSLATSGAQVTTGSGSDTISGFENLTGSANNDHLTGNSGANILRGVNGNDTVIGGSGNDTLYGDAGNDLLRGGAGDDILYGGAGKDLFRFDTALNTSTAPNIDRIKDFSVADDTIQLENAIFAKFGASTTGTIDTAHFKANTTGLAADSDDYIIYETDTGKLFYDADGNGAGISVQIAIVGANLALTNADFVLV